MLCRPVANAIDLVQGSRGMWTIDFGLMSDEEAALYEMPFEYVKKSRVPDTRLRIDRARYARTLVAVCEARPGLRQALTELTRFIATPEVAKHRVFVWMVQTVLLQPAHLVFARDDDYFFGVLHSRIHEVWALAHGHATARG